MNEMFNHREYTDEDGNVVCDCCGIIIKGEKDETPE